MQHEKIGPASILHLVLLVVTLTTLLYQPNFSSGLINHFEAGQWLVSANDVLHGKIIYKETIAYHGPLTTYLQVLFMLLFGVNVTSLKWFFVTSSFLTLLTACLIGYKLFRNRFMMYLLAFFLVAETVSPFWICWWGGFRFCFGLMGLLFFIDYMQNAKTSSAFITGLMISLALFTSIDGGVVLAITVLFGYIFFAWGQRRLGNTVKYRHIIWFFCGFAAFAVPFCFYMLKIGAFFSYLETTLILATNHVHVWGQTNAGINFGRAISISNILKIEFKVLATILLNVLSAIYVAGRLQKNTLQYQDYGMVCLIIYGSLMCLLSLRAAIGTQLQMALQPTLILAFCFLKRTYEILRQHLGNNRGSVYSKFIKEQASLRVGLALIIFCSIVSYLVLSEKVSYCDTMDFFYYQTHKKDFLPVYISFIPVEKVKLVVSTSKRAEGLKVLPSFTDIESASKYIASVTEPDEQIFTFPDLGICNFLADRVSASRFGIALYAWTYPQWREELLGDLRRLKPRYIIGGNLLSDLARSIGQKDELLPEVINYINSNYLVETSFGSIDILKATQR